MMGLEQRGKEGGDRAVEALNITWEITLNLQGMFGGDLGGQLQSLTCLLTLSVSLKRYTNSHTHTHSTSSSSVK